MKVTGIIAEYNPFHNGHKYQIEQARKLTGADYIIVVMSGNFTQRGEPALLDKYVRTKMALENGADLVIELPACYACSSAEYFSLGAITLLHKLNIVDCICFGSECGKIDTLASIAKIFAFEPQAYQQVLKSHLRDGDSFPVARSKALAYVMPEFIEEREVISCPNNILGIEYIKTLLRLDSPIVPYTNQRIGSNYHDYRLSTAYSSAIAIRQAIHLSCQVDAVKSQMPDSCYSIMNEALLENTPIFADDFSNILKYRLLLDEYRGYTRYADISNDLSNKIQKVLYSADSFNDFCRKLKTKNFTYSRISRCLTHILLDIRKEYISEYLEEGAIFYARILGFKKDASQLLTLLSTHAAVPLITKVSVSRNLLDGIAQHQFERDIAISHIYESVSSSKSGKAMRNEYTREIVKG